MGGVLWTAQEINTAKDLAREYVRRFQSTAGDFRDKNRGPYYHKMFEAMSGRKFDAANHLFMMMVRKIQPRTSSTGTVKIGKRKYSAKGYAALQKNGAQNLKNKWDAIKANLRGLGLRDDQIERALKAKPPKIDTEQIATIERRLALRGHARVDFGIHENGSVTMKFSTVEYPGDMVKQGGENNLVSV